MQAFQNQDLVDSQWASLNYSEPPEMDGAVKEYDSFVDMLRESVDEIHFLPADERTGMDSIYVRDAAIMTRSGAILCRMGKNLRMGEPEATGDALSVLGIPIIGSITGDGRLEGGDCVNLDGQTLIVGQGYRTNAAGIEQLKRLTEGIIEEIVAVPLPHWNGPGDVLHLMSFFSPLSSDMALVYSRLMPVPFREWLIERGVHLIEVPDEEFESMGCNVLVLRPGLCLMLEGNPRTRRCIEKRGIEVRTYRGNEISRKGAGGPTCLTRPIVRNEVISKREEPG